MLFTYMHAWCGIEKGEAKVKTISIINLKGGVAKTTTAVSMAELFASKHGERVLLFDNDKQGNTSRLFKIYNGNETIGACEILRTGIAENNIAKSKNQRIDIVPCNFCMELVENEIKADIKMSQHDRYKRAFEEINANYDFCIIDNPPDVGMNVINALVASQEIIIPVNLDNYSLDGLTELVEQINQIKVLNKDAKLVGCLITDYEKSDTSEAAERWLREKSGFPIFRQKIRHSKKAKDATFYNKTVIEYSIRSGAAQDYKKFTNEYLTERGM